MVENSTACIFDKDVLEQIQKRISNIGEYIKGTLENRTITQREELIKGINKSLTTMFKNTDFFQHNTFVYKGTYSKGSDIWNGNWIWYPAIKQDDWGDLSLCADYYELSLLFKKEKLIYSCLLTFNNFKWNPELLSIYYKFTEAIPEIIAAYEEFIIQTS